MASILDKAKSALGGGNKHTVSLGGKFNVYETGYGLMGLTSVKTPRPIDDVIATMKAALDEGANFWNGGTFYGPPDNNSIHILKEYFTRYPEDADKVVLSIKGAFNIQTGKPEGSPESIRKCIDDIVEGLGGTKKLDIFEPARVDSTVPIEITVTAIQQMIDEGKCGAITLSECSADTIRRAAKVVDIVGVEVECSMWATEIFDNDVAKVCAEHNIAVIAYSPLGRGFLTGSLRKPEDMAEDDNRRHWPRFQPGNFEKNMDIVYKLEAIAKKKNATSGQIGLAWVKAQGKKPGMPTMLPIPGSSSPERLRENMGVVELSEADVKELDAIVESASVSGARYPEMIEKLNFGNSPALEPGMMEAAFARK